MKTKLKNIKITEVSLVKRGANEGAKVALFKAADVKTEDGKMFPASDFAYVPDPNKPSTWKLRLTATPSGPPDTHIVGAAVAALGEGFRGNKVEIPQEDRARVVARVRAAWKKLHEGEDVPNVLKTVEEVMSEKQHEELQAKIDELTAQLNKALWTAGLSDVEKTHYARLNDTEKEAFEKLDPDARKASMSADESFETEGQTIRKSEVGDTIYAVLKSQADRAANAEKTAKDEREARLQKEAEAEAQTLLPHLAGTAAEKAELLKGAGEKQREILKAADEAMAKAMTTTGADGSGEEETAVQQIDKMAKALAEEKKIDYGKAYMEVLSTKEGKALYAETIKQ